MPHRIHVEGRIEKVVKRGGEKYAVLRDTTSYIHFLIPNNGYVVGQMLAFEGQIVEAEKSTQFIRLMGHALPTKEA